ncbi:hypothetical protein NHX12_011441, partial [Muraenolepis orangiensis]
VLGYCGTDDSLPWLICYGCSLYSSDMLENTSDGPLFDAWYQELPPRLHHNSPGNSHCTEISFTDHRYVTRSDTHHGRHNWRLEGRPDLWVNRVVAMQRQHFSRHHCPKQHEKHENAHFLILCFK